MNLNSVEQYLASATCNINSQTEVAGQYAKAQSNLAAVAGEAAADLKSTNDYIIQILQVIGQLSTDIADQYTTVLSLQRKFND